MAIETDVLKLNKKIHELEEFSRKISELVVDIANLFGVEYKTGEEGIVLNYEDFKNVYEELTQQNEEMLECLKYYVQLSENNKYNPKHDKYTKSIVEKITEKPIEEVLK